ncbi:MAG TPA: carboxylesterase family protein [Bryobacteraceae bacterium]|nr:carboxylesterase family protein [Bryobacteraceae bacterium]
MLLLVAAAMMLASAATPSFETKIDTGKLQGASQDGVTSYKGIPFAAAPVGDLRWRPPQPVKAWTGVRAATEYGPDCAQLPFPGDAAPLGVPPAEDCLYANVWAPDGSAGKKLPVMLWIYGGGFVNGGSSPSVYDGSQFAKHGIVFVSFNYRVGRFGFFGFPALTKENPNEPKGNYGYMDQIAALQWVKRNATAFGGDASNVTIFGESAGGGSVLTLMTSPMAKGLFKRAVVESGGGRTLLMGQRYLSKQVEGGPASAESVGVAFAKKNNIEGDDAAALAALRKLPWKDVVAGLNMASMGTPTYAGPMIDGKVVVESPADAYAAGRGAKVPFMIGANSADIGFSFARTVDDLFKPFGADKDKAMEAYGATSSTPVGKVSPLFGADQMMIEPARFAVRTLAALGVPAYEYRFSYVAESLRSKLTGAPHATEIPFVFDTVEARYGKELTDADRAAARAANAYWANFAKTGNPNGPGLPKWPEYSPKTDILMNFTATGPVAEPDPLKSRLDLVEKLANEKK